MSSKSKSNSPSKPKDERRVYVTGFSLKQTEEDIRNTFKVFGQIDELSWKGRFCFITFSNQEEALEAINQMNKKDLNGNQLLVEQARAKKNDGACFNCGKPGHFARNCRDRRSRHHRRRSSSNSSSSSSSRPRKHKKRRQRSSSSSS